MASKDDITFTIGVEPDEANIKNVFKNLSSMLSSLDKKEINAFSNKNTTGGGLLAKANKYRAEYEAAQRAINKSPREVLGKLNYTYFPHPRAKLSRKELKEVNAFASRHSEEIANKHLQRFLNIPERGLLAKAGKYRKEIDEQKAISELMGVGSVPTAPAHEQYLGLKEFKANNAKEEKAFEAKLSALASSLDNSIGSAADNKIKDMMKERGINEGLLAKAERLKTASSLDDAIAPNAESRIDSAIKAKEEEMSKLASSLDETIGKSFDERLNGIQTPSGADTNETDIQKENKALKDQEKEKKNNAKEEKGSLIRFGKMLVTLHLIKKVLNSIKDIWKRLSDTELKVTSRDVKEKGFFSIDSYSAMHANVDRSHAVISRGLGYMGTAAPFSMDAFDSVLKQLQDLNLKAISGQGIADDQLVISLQRLSDTLGMGFNIKDILTDPNLNLTDFLTNLMNSVEKFLPKLNSLDDIKKSLVTNDIIKALGPELANALVYNYNYNQRTGGTSTVMEQVTSKGTNAYGLIDYTEEAKKFTDALASSRAALDDFKVALGGVFAPAGKKAANLATEKLAEGTMLLNAIKADVSPMNYTLLYSGVTKNGSVDNEELAEWYKFQENKERAVKKIESAKNLKSLDDVLNMAYYNPTALSAGTSGSSLETTVGVWMGSRLAERIKGKTFNQLKELKESGDETFSDKEWGAIEEIYAKKNKKKWKFNQTGNDIYNTKAWQNEFGEGGDWDLMYGVSPTTYAKKMLGEEEYQTMLASLLLEQNNLLNAAGLVKEGGVSYYTKDEYDKQGNKISGTVVFKLELSDGTTREIPTIVEDGVLKAIANQPR